MPFSFSRHKSWRPHIALPASHAAREYECLELSSGLKCILINDASSHMISAAMAIGAGSYSDPQVLGLAHLCEHIVCMGDKSVQLQNILMASGGSFSASTGADQTTFGFEISTFAHESAGKEQFLLDSALPMFASLLKSPRISNSMVAKQIGFVDDEHNMNKSDMEKMLWHGLRLLSNGQHPFSRFSTGNKATLAGVSGLKRMISDHHARAFLPANSALVIKGPQSINHLRKALLCAYGDLAYVACPEPKPLQNDIFSEADPNCMFIKSGTRKIRLCYSMRKSSLKVPATVQSILAYVLGDESRTSLCHYLRYSKHYIERLYAYTQKVSRDDTFFILAFECTETGMYRLKDLLAVVFYYIEEVMGKLTESTWSRVAHEYVEIDEYLFMTNSGEEDGEEVTMYAENLQMGSGFLRGDWDPSCLVQQSFKFFLGQFFDRSSLKLQICDSNPKALLQFRQNLDLVQDTYFDFEYVKFQCPFDNMHYVNSDVGSSMCVAYPIGDLRQEIPDLLEFQTIISSAKYRHISSAPESPILHSQTPTQEVWLVQTPFVHRSSASIYIDFRMFRKNAESLVLLEVMAAITGQRLKSRFYNLELFGSSWGIYANIHGEPSLLITVSGRPSIVTYILETALREIFGFSDYTCHYNELKSARVYLRRKFEEYIHEKGIKQVHVMIYQLLEQGIVSPEQRIQTLEMLDAGSLQELSLLLLECQNFTQILMSGDFSEAQIDTVARNCRSMQPSRPDFPERSLDSSISLANGAYYEFQLLNDESDPVAVVLYYVQITQRSDRYSYTLSKVLQQMIQASAYHNLRDKRDLAYTISTGMKVFRDNFGLHITIPTTKHSTGHVVEQMEAYMGDLEASLNQMNEAVFETSVKKPFLQALADDSEEDINPSSLFGSIRPLQGSENQTQDASFHRHWCALDQIIRKAYNFGSKGCEEAIDEALVEQLTLSEFRAFFGVKFAIKSPDRSALILTLGPGEPRDSKKRFSMGTKMKFRKEKPRERRIFRSIHEFQKHTLHTF